MNLNTPICIVKKNVHAVPELNQHIKYHYIVYQHFKYHYMFYQHVKYHGYKWPLDRVNQLSMYATSYYSVNASWESVFESRVQRFFFLILSNTLDVILGEQTK